jgi:broad specificity phosphatase PhoE
MRPLSRVTLARLALPLAALLAPLLVPPLAAPALAQPVSKEGAAAAPSAPTVVIVVRHAEKAAEPANDPPLTAAGEARAQALAASLADANVAAVLSTPFARTRATGAPLAAKLGLTTEVIPVSGGLPAHAAAVASAVREKYRGRTVVVVEHSNTVPAVVRALGGPPLRDLCDAQYASLFVLVLADSSPGSGQPPAPARLVRSTYGAPDPAGADACQSSGMR